MSGEERILDALLRPARGASVDSTNTEESSSTRQRFRKMLREGKLDEKEIEVDVREQIGVEIVTPPGMEDMSSQIQNLFQNMNTGRTKTRKVKVKDARKLMLDDEAAKLINEDELKLKALNAVEQNGIVFLDEMDKICKRQEHSGGDVSREGVQRDLLPLVEGCTVSTKHGMIKTDHILFIASGAFHLTKPSDLIPELQGRLPIRVELNALVAKDFVRILTEPSASLTEQYAALMSTENLTLEFTDDGIQRIAEVAWEVNERTENIGARRLHTVMERLLETISYEASDMGGNSVVITKEYVDEHLSALVVNEDLSRYIL